MSCLSFLLFIHFNPLVKQMQQEKEVEMDRLLEGSLNWTGSSSMEKLSMLIMPFFMIPTFSRAWWRDSAALRMLGSQCISASSKYSENYA